MVSAWRRRLPSTGMEFAVRAVCARAGAPKATDRARIPPRSKPATTSPRLTRTHMPMHKRPLPLVAAPQWRISAPRLSLRAIESCLLVLSFSFPRGDHPHRRPSVPLSPVLASRHLNDLIQIPQYPHHD